METKLNVITVSALVNAPIEKVWKLWTTPSDIQQWNAASPDWHSPRAEHDLKPGGQFSYRMEAKDGSFGFDFGGTFDVVTEAKYLEYTLGDGRKVKVDFKQVDEGTQIHEQFEAESQNPEEMQQAGWQAILDNFNGYAEKA